jgi:hypothetical protein
MTSEDNIIFIGRAAPTPPNPQISLHRRRTFSPHVKPVPGSATLRRYGKLLIAINELPM